MHRFSVRLRIALTIFVASTAALVATALGVYVRFESVLSANLDESLAARAEVDLEAAANPGASKPASEVLVRFYGADGTIEADPTVLLPATTAEAALVREALDGRPRLATLLYSDGEFRVEAQPRFVDGRVAGAVVSGLSYEQVSDPLGELRTILLLAVPFTSVLLGLLSYLIARRALKPVGSITAAARAITAGELHRRLDVTSGDELGELARTFNEMIARLEETIERERRFASDAAHELRTPLTGLTTAIEVTLSAERNGDEYRRTLASLAGQTRRLHQLVGRLLLLTRADSGTVQAEFAAIDVGELLTVLQDTFRDNHPGIEVTLTALGSVLVNGDLELLAAAFNNVMENAAQHGGAAARLAITVSAAAGRVIVDFADNGPGISTDMRATAFRRFRRGSSATNERSGLGLAIAESIAKLHGGSVELLAPPAGALVRFRFSSLSR